MRVTPTTPHRPLPPPAQYRVVSFAAASVPFLVSRLPATLHIPCILPLATPPASAPCPRIAAATTAAFLRILALTAIVKHATITAAATTYRHLPSQAHITATTATATAFLRIFSTTTANIIHATFITAATYRHRLSQATTAAATTATTTIKPPCVDLPTTIQF